MNNALAEAQEHAPVVANEPATIMQAITRAASDPSVDVDKLERMMAMYERMQAKSAEQQFNEALNAAQHEVGRVAADANNPQTRSRYATYAALDRALRPVYARHGFSLSFDTGEGAPPDCVRVVCYVSHRGGHTRTYRMDMPADGKGAKGGDVMTKTHAAGSAMSYGMRYLLKGIFNVAVGEDDDDGNGATPGERITEKQVADIEALMSDVGADRARFLLYLNKWLGIESFDEIPAASYSGVIKALEAKRQ